MEEGLLMAASALLRLDEQLESEAASLVLARAWDVFGIVAKLAHCITFDEGSDELQAMIVSQQCSEGRDRLPLPETSLLVTAAQPEPGGPGLARVP
ncbi:hypothetical protein [Streptomyces erythrochromogenes]|uniref:hypothetical protein n=1 Tax=Streptomyces erythrochromogenes TaxID=285574 RepID=UPI0033DFC1F6